jgi:ribonuclease BN (tRNA processing enzyme)
MTRVRGTFAGSGDAFGSGGRLQACVHLSADTGEQVLLDCGATALVGLKRHGIDPAEVSAVVLSHLHGDHFGGLPYVILDGQFRRRRKPLDILGPVGTAERLGQAMEVLFPGSSTIDRAFAVRVHEIECGESVKRDGYTVVTYPAEHHPGANAMSLRIDFGDVSVGYSGDTAWNETLVDVARGTDVFICEAYSLTRPMPYHLHVPHLRENRSRLECRRLILTHPSPDLLAEAAELEFDLADDDTVFEI